MSKNLVLWEPIVDQLEKLVVEGQHDQVKIQIDRLNPNRIPRNFISKIAEISWRISEPLITLKLLNKIIFPENHLIQDATANEKFIYATALANLGAVQEALQIFETINPDTEPEVSLRKALAHFRVWNYPAAIPLLEKFVADKNITSYRKLIGKVNLAAALVIDLKNERIDSLLHEIQSECIQNNYLLLLGNSYELQSQVHFFRKDYDQALTAIEKAMELLKNQSGEFFLYAEKWKLVTLAFKLRSDSAVNELKAFKIKAISLNQQETVRDCDLFEAILTKNENLLRKVILGTPFEYFRQRARTLSGQHILAQGYFQLRLGTESETKKYFVFKPYEVQKGIQGLHSKSQLLALFNALTIDFYKTNHIGLLFQRVYPNEKFNPFTSPQRVLGLIRRLNLWFDENDVPLSVRMKKSEFALIAKNNQPVEILIQRAKNLSKADGNKANLREIFKDRTFSTTQVSVKLNISKSSAQQLLIEAVEQGYVKKIGNGRGTTYAIVSKNRKKVAA